jgi:hypothetical protein
LRDFQASALTGAKVPAIETISAPGEKFRAREPDFAIFSRPDRAGSPIRVPVRFATGRGPVRARERRNSKPVVMRNDGSHQQPIGWRKTPWPFRELS